MRITLFGVKIGSHIQKARKAKKLTQAELSDACGWGYQQGRISHYETNTRQPDLDDLETLAKVLDVRISDLLGESTPPPPSKRIANLAEKLIALPPSRQKLIVLLIDELQSR